MKQVSLYLTINQFESLKNGLKERMQLRIFCTDFVKKNFQEEIRYGALQEFPRILRKKSFNQI